MSQWAQRAVWRKARSSKMGERQKITAPPSTHSIRFVNRRRRRTAASPCSIRLPQTKRPKYWKVPGSRPRSRPKGTASSGMQSARAAAAPAGQLRPVVKVSGQPRPWFLMASQAA